MSRPGNPPLSLSLDLNCQYAAGISPSSCPDQAQLCAWFKVAATLLPELAAMNSVGLSVRYVDLQESQDLNLSYRGFDKPTNVLSFPGVFADLPPELLAELDEHERGYLGDLAICPAILDQEADEQGKARSAHHCHLFIHGLLHLIGYDHLTQTEAEQMEALEVAILAALDYPHPYQLS